VLFTTMMNLRRLAESAMSSEAIAAGAIRPPFTVTPVMEHIGRGMCLSIPAEAGGIPSEFASVALEPLRNGYVNAEEIRLDGGLRVGLR
jgi:hypothetical protein